MNCSTCGRSESRRWVRGLCEPCYNREMYEARKGRAAAGIPKRERGLPNECGHEDAPAYGNRMCRPCWGRSYYSENRDEILTAQKEYRDADLPRESQRRRRYYAVNRNAVISRRCAKREAQPEWWRALVHRQNKARRARLAGAHVEPGIDFNDIYWRDGGRCQLCSEHVATSDVNFDHIIPLSKGGEHSALNIQLAHARCNKRRFNTGPAQLRMLA